MKWAWAIVGVALIVFAGCIAKVTVDKRPNLALTLYSNTSTNPVEYVIVDQGYVVKYKKFGFSTEIETMQAELTTNKTVKFSLGGLHSYSTNSISINLDQMVNILKMFRESTNWVDSAGQVK